MKLTIEMILAKAAPLLIEGAMEEEQRSEGFRFPEIGMRIGDAFPYIQKTKDKRVK